MGPFPTIKKFLSTTKSYHHLQILQKHFSIIGTIMTDVCAKNVKKFQGVVIKKQARGAGSLSNLQRARTFQTSEIHF